MFFFVLLVIVVLGAAAYKFRVPLLAKILGQDESRIKRQLKQKR
jgi:F0F1-type ATP synthase membrane subunit b/b'